MLKKHFEKEVSVECFKSEMEDWKSLVAGIAVMRRQGGRSNPH